MLDWPLIGIRFGLYLTMAALFGLSAFSLYGLKAGERGNALALRGWLIGSAAISLLLSVAWFASMTSSMADVPIWPVDWEAVGAMLTGNAVAAAWKVRMAALGLALVAALAPAGHRVALVIVALAGAVALSTLPWTGHGAMDEDTVGWVHLAADILHLIASGAWVGALIALVLLVSQPVARVDAAHLALTHRALHGFGVVGTIVVATIVITGLVNSWLLIGISKVWTLGATTYGQLLLAKLALFVTMLALASLNRFWLTPRFEQSIVAEDHNFALAALRVSLAVEIACVVAVMGLVAWLGTLDPPVSAM